MCNVQTGEEERGGEKKGFIRFLPHSPNEKKNAVICKPRAVSSLGVVPKCSTEEEGHRGEGSESYGSILIRAVQRKCFCNHNVGSNFCSI